MSESLHYDVAIVGGGPAGMAAALRLGQLGREHGRPLSVCLLEKAGRIGGHLLSGALLDPAPLARLIPAWEAQGAPLKQRVTGESLQFLTPRGGHALPVPRGWRHTGQRIASLGALVRWLGERAEGLGVELFPGFAAVEPIWQGERLAGVMTGPMGLKGDGAPGPGYQPGVAIRARATLLAEGCRGSVTGQVVARLGLARGRCPQTYGLGLKMLWRVAESRPGEVLHTLGHPLDRHTHGGGFLYHLPGNRVALGLVVGLDYGDPWLDPFAAFQQWREHPLIAPLLAGGEPLAYGARTLVEGGWQALPRLALPGGLLLGDAAGLLDAARLQGVGNALDSGRLAAETLWRALADSATPGVERLAPYADAVRNAEWGQRLRAVRNVRPGFRAGRPAGLLNAAWEGITAGRSPWTWRWRRRDRACLRRVEEDGPGATHSAIHGPPHSGDTPPPPAARTRESALALAGITHREGQPCHLHLGDPGNFPAATAPFGHPEERYCPGGVYQLLDGGDGANETKRLLRHAGNCLHCKCCDIKDPAGRIVWTPPEGGSGPDYGGL